MTPKYKHEIDYERYGAHISVTDTDGRIAAAEARCTARTIGDAEHVAKLLSHWATDHDLAYRELAGATITIQWVEDMPKMYKYAPESTLVTVHILARGKAGRVTDARRERCGGTCAYGSGGEYAITIAAAAKMHPGRLLRVNGASVEEIYDAGYAAGRRAVQGDQRCRSTSGGGRSSAASSATPSCARLACPTC